MGLWGRRRGKRLASEKREGNKWEERERVRKVFAVAPPMALDLLVWKLEVSILSNMHEM